MTILRLVLSPRHTALAFGRNHGLHFLARSNILGLAQLAANQGPIRSHESFTRLYSTPHNNSRHHEHPERQQTSPQGSKGKSRFSPKPQINYTKVAAAAALVAVSAYATDEYLFASVAQRSIRALWVLTHVAYKYYNMADAQDTESVHEEAATALNNMLRKNKGLYIKLGQAIANQGALLPPAYQRKLVGLYDSAPTLVHDWSETAQILQESVGDINTYFDEIDHEPVALALMAQVHKAVINGQPVAVKIQHPYISRQIKADLAVYRWALVLYSRVFDLPLLFFTDHVQEQMLREADFTVEAANARRLKELFTGDKEARALNVYVPRCIHALRKVLVLEWVDGVSLTDRDRLVEAGASLPRLMEQYIGIFAKQIFEYGFVHLDPHPGNLLLRFQGGKQQLVLLDHGLCVLLPPKFRDEYRDLWCNLLSWDSSATVRVAEQWGIGSPEMLRSLILLRPPKTVSDKVPTLAEMLRLLLSDDSKFPKPLIFLIRTMRMMQNLNQTMGSPVNRVNILAKTALKTQPVSSISDFVSFVTAKVSLCFGDIVFWIFRARQILKGDRYGDKGEGVEDFIEKVMRQNAKAIGIELA